MTFDPEVERIFHEIADLETRCRLEYFQLHAITDEIRFQVNSLLACDLTSAESLSQLVRGQIGTSLSDVHKSSPGDLCGPYRLLKLIGRGGMAEVWLAERLDGLVNRPVALKIPHTGFQGSEFAQRAHREREILASLAHHGIARLYDAGIAEGGRPFLVLEFVEGVALDRYCDAHQLPVPSRISLFLQVLAAVQYAHSHLVIHSDLKPSNILVAPDCEVKLLDFGIASLMKGGELFSQELACAEHVALTPGYAAPEQIAGQRVTTACDVYSLGVILFELLSGSRPSPIGNQSEHSDALPAPVPTRPASKLPSQAADTAKARDRASTPKKLAAALKGDLDDITLKAIHPNPDHRYVTVDAFKSDLERYLRGEPVIAAHASFWYRGRKFVARHRATLAAAAVVAVALAVGFSVALWQSRVARQEA